MAEIEITEEQKARIPEYAEMGLKWASRTEPVDREAGKEYSKRLMDYVGRPYKATFYGDGPVESWMMAILLVLEREEDLKAKSTDSTDAYKEFLGELKTRGTKTADDVKVEITEELPKVRDRIFGQSWVGLSERLNALKELSFKSKAEAENALWKVLRVGVVDKILTQAEEQMSGKDMKELKKEFGGTLLRYALEDKPGETFYQSFSEFVWPYLEGQYFAYWVAWANFYRDVVGVEMNDYSLLEDQIQFGMVYPLDQYVVISECPNALHQRESQLHCDGGPAVEYADGVKLYSLNGVRVPQWLAETRAEELDPRSFAEIDNVEVRREFVRKVGMERILEHLDAEVLDSEGDYELLAVDLGDDVGTWKYLKMKNPSIGVWHLECDGNSPDTKTVQDAINFRAQNLKHLKGDWQPEKLT